MSDTDVPIEAVNLITQIMTWNAEQGASIRNCLIAANKADADAVFFGVRHALNAIPNGGTTAEYERGLERIANALYPHPRIRDFYLERAERWIQGERDSDQGQALHPEHRTNEGWA